MKSDVVLGNVHVLLETMLIIPYNIDVRINNLLDKTCRDIHSKSNCF